VATGGLGCHFSHPDADHNPPPRESHNNPDLRDQLDETRPGEVESRHFKALPRRSNSKRTRIRRTVRSSSTPTPPSAILREMELHTQDKPLLSRMSVSPQDPIRVIAEFQSAEAARALLSRLFSAASSRRQGSNPISHQDLHDSHFPITPAHPSFRRNSLRFCSLPFGSPLFGLTIQTFQGSLLALSVRHRPPRAESSTFRRPKKRRDRDARLNRRRPKFEIPTEGRLPKRSTRPRKSPAPGDCARRPLARDSADLRRHSTRFEREAAGTAPSDRRTRCRFSDGVGAGGAELRKRGGDCICEYVISRDGEVIPIGKVGRSFPGTGMWVLRFRLCERSRTIGQPFAKRRGKVD
jgi:hypothetical protein